MNIEETKDSSSNSQPESSNVWKVASRKNTEACCELAERTNYQNAGSCVVDAAIGSDGETYFTLYAADDLKWMLSPADQTFLSGMVSSSPGWRVLGEPTRGEAGRVYLKYGLSIKVDDVLNELGLKPDNELSCAASESNAVGSRRLRVAEMDWRFAPVDPTTMHTPA